MKLIWSQLRVKGNIGICVLILGCVMGILMGTAVGALAQDSRTESAPAVSEQAEAVIDTVMVTAQKREENVQDVPLSMSVLSETDIEDAGMQDITDLTFFTPNVYSKQNINQNMLIIRGISSHNVVLNTPAGLFVDDINYPMTFMQNPDLMDIERVEILRGPQGTLYGRNTESGAVNIITRQPGNEVTGKVFLEPGFHDTPDGDSPMKFRTGASLSGPVVPDTLYLGGAFQLENSDGYVENVYDGNDEAAKIDHVTGQVKLRWTPGRAWDLNLLANAFETNDGYGYVRYKDGPSASDRYTINWNGLNKWEDENNGQALRVKYAGAAFNIVSITTRNDYMTGFENDGEFGLAPIPDQVWNFENTAYSQEFRFSSGEEGPLEWLVGVYGFKEDWDVHAAYFGNVVDTDWEGRGYALFGQATYTVMDRLHFTVGLRYDSLDSDGRQTSSIVNGTYGAGLDHSEVLPKASVSFDLTPGTMCYAQAAKGMLAGGYDYAFATSSDTLTFDPEYSWNYEAGIKAVWFGGKLKANAAVYTIDIEDKQVQEWLAGPAVRRISNAAEAHSSGFELEVEARPFKGVTLFGGIGFTEAEVDTWVSDEMTGGTFDYSGKNLTHAPEYTFNVGFQYMHESGFFGRADLLGVGEYYNDAKNEFRGESYETVNLRIGFEGESFQIALWCKNIFDEAYLLNESYYIGGNIVQDGAPRTIGATFTYRF